MANRKQPKYQLDPSKAELHISKGNAKIGKGIFSYSTLPGNAEHMITLKDGTLLTDIPGTCSKYCEGCAKDGACYAWRDAKLHSNATIPAWGENTLLQREGRVWDEVGKFLTLKNGKAQKYLREAHEAGTDPEVAVRQARKLAVVKLFRIHVSGEVESASQLRKWNIIALAHPETVFGLYTKNFDALAEFLDGDGEEGSGDSFAPNFVVNVSEWHGVAKPFLEKHAWAKLNVFEYCPTNRKDCDLPDDEVARIEALPKCPAVTRSGHHATLPNGEPVTCSICKKCYTKTGRHIGVWSH